MEILFKIINSIIIITYNIFIIFFIFEGLTKMKHIIIDITLSILISFVLLFGTIWLDLDFIFYLLN